MKQDTFILPNLNYPKRSETVLIVSIIGKSSYSAFSQKTKPLGRVFKTDKVGQSVIEGLFDEPNQIIYLHLRGLFDTANLIQHYEELVNQCEREDTAPDFNTIYNEVKNSYSRAMLLLFHISHIIVVSQPGSNFDLSYLQILKCIENARLKCATQVTGILKEIPEISPEWITNRRLCTPRLVFYFEKCPKKVVQNGSIKKLEHAVEDKIYNIFRKAKLLNNNSANCLFAIPPNQEYVYINTESDPTIDPLSHALTSLIQSCLQTPTPPLEFTYAMHSDPNPDKRSFVKFLQMHTSHAFVKGFDDNLGRSATKAHFEMPTVETWFQAANKLYQMFCEEKNLQGLEGLEIDTRFSEQRCLKVLPLAVARYQEGLPPHYTKAFHENRLAVAMTVFTNHARGSKFEHYSKQLIADCVQHFENGRELCEAPSLTGNPCTLPKHDTDKEHCSGVRYVAACDCGRSQGSREDPYNVKYANHTFYQLLQRDCSCVQLERIEFPVFQPSSQEFRAAKVEASVQEGASGESVSLTDDLILDLIDEEKSLIRQASTTEYLPGMLTTTSPTGLLPQFSSWSLVCLGPSSLYSHNLGLPESQYPGFWPGSNFLLPWDVTVRPANKWPLVDRKYGGRNSQKKQKVGAEVTVKVFVGIEYECPRGHRFMMSSPDKVLRATSGIVKESGHKVTNSDMPLFFNCPCRQNKPLVAQLMRIHVVSPKNIVFITLNPKIQPGSGAPIFIPGSDNPIKLTQSTYWILRLPYVYVADREPFIPPHHAPITNQPPERLLQGMWGVVNM